MEAEEAAPQPQPLPSLAVPPPPPLLPLWTPTPPPPPTQPQVMGNPDIVLGVSRRLLWVGEAAYPLHNIVRVQTFVLSPNRGQALTQFLPFIALLLLAFAGYVSAGNGPGTVVVLVLVVLLSAELVRRLTRPDVYVMGVETSGAPVAVVTLADRAELRKLVRLIVDAIEHPDAEFSHYVAQLTVNIKQYTHNGDNANISGAGNIGILK